MLLTDEERYPPHYETEELKQWRKEALKGREKIREHGVEFHRHYTSATACTPSRASIFLGHYPSLHGCFRTGTGEDSDAADGFRTWLDAENFPTMGHYFKSAGYSTHYIGKWHLSNEDLHDEHGKRIDSSYWGKPIEENEKRYKERFLLKKFGWDNPWVGPEPHGVEESNFGLFRDGLYIQQAIQELEELAANPEQPFIMVISLVNPHDIVTLPLYYKYVMKGEIDSKSLPEIPEPPNFAEDLTTKPSTIAKSYSAVKKMLGNLPIHWDRYRRFYYHLHKVVDIHIETFMDALDRLKLSEETLMVFTSDHGDLISSHGGGIQKFYNAYDESIRVPLVFRCPALFREETQHVHDYLTSAVDLLPTVLYLAGIKVEETYSALDSFTDEYHKHGFKEVPKLIGKNFAAKVTLHALDRALAESALETFAAQEVARAQHSVLQGKQAIYFMTEDEITKCYNFMSPVYESLSFLTWFMHGQFDAIRGACHIEAAICYVPERKETYKIVRFWENSEHWTHPNEKDVIYKVEGPKRGNCEIVTACAPDEYELYNLTKDPSEMFNLIGKPKNEDLECEMKSVLVAIREQQRVYPSKNVSLPKPSYENGLCNPPDTRFPPAIRLLITAGMASAVAWHLLRND